ncbi:MAG: hypothetical protein AB1705_12885 [Verrucomicrobiota bacterium]
MDSAPNQAADQARFVREHLPPGGLFANQHWRISPAPFPLDADLVKQLDNLGRVILQFYRAVNLLYRQSVEGKQPSWVADWLDRGKPKALLELSRSAAFKNDVPRVLRPDLLLTDAGLSVTELDSVPGGIGLTAWLGQTYSQLAQSSNASATIIGGADGMLKGFASIFGGAPNVHIVVSEESATYRPEMEWLVSQLRDERFKVQSPDFTNFAEGDAVYRFFELFDLANVPISSRILELALDKHLRLTPPPKPVFEEKMLFALLWNRNLHGFWRQNLGEGFLQRLQKLVPYTWIVDPTPLPPQGAIPELNLTDWHQLKAMSQRERDLILKVSGFSENAWGARGVYLGSDLSQTDWSVAVDTAINSASTAPHILQRYHKPRTVEAAWFDFDRNTLVPMQGRVRLCPYYFVSGEGDAARAQLAGVLATVCDADKKIIHGMRDAILAPCAA